MKLHRLGLILGWASFFSVVASCGNSGDQTTGAAGSGGVGGSAGASGNGGATSDHDSGDGGAAGASTGGSVCPDAGFEDGSAFEDGSDGEPVGNPRCAVGVRTGVCCRNGVDHSCLNTSGDFCGCNPRNMWSCGNI